MRWTDEMQEYLNTLSARNLSLATIKQYKYTLAETLSEINKPASTITKKDLNAYLNKKDAEIAKKKEFIPAKTQLSSQSKKLILIIMRNYLQYFKNYETANAIKEIKIKTSYKEPIQITQQEAKTLTTQRMSSNPQLNQRNALLMELLFESGMRRAEIASLTCSIFKNYDPKEQNQILIITGKGDKERKIIIPTSWMKKYLAYADDYKIDLSDPSQAIFMSNKLGTPLTPVSITNLVKQISSHANVIYNKHSISPHKLRSTFATNLNDSGENVLKIQALLGHSNLDTTKKYVKIKDEELKKTKIKTV